MKTVNGGIYPEGISLWDYFAGQTLNGMVSNQYFLTAVMDEYDDDEKLFGKLSKMAYQLADAMLKAREQSNGN